MNSRVLELHQNADMHNKKNQQQQNQQQQQVHRDDLSGSPSSSLWHPSQKEIMPRIRTASTLQAMKVKLNKQITSSSSLLSSRMISNHPNHNSSQLAFGAPSSASTTMTLTTTAPTTLQSKTNNSHTRFISMQLDLNDFAVVNAGTHSSNGAGLIFNDEFADGFLESTITDSSKHAFTVSKAKQGDLHSQSAQSSCRLFHHAKSRSAVALASPNVTSFSAGNPANAAIPAGVASTNSAGQGNFSHNTSMMTVVKQTSSNNNMTALTLLQTPATAAGSDLNASIQDTPMKRAMTPVERTKPQTQANNMNSIIHHAFTPTVSRKQKTLSASTHSTSVTATNPQSNAFPASSSSSSAHASQRLAHTYHHSKAAFSLKPVQIQSSNTPNNNNTVSTSFTASTSKMIMNVSTPSVRQQDQKQTHFKVNLRPQTSLAVIVEPSKKLSSNFQSEQSQQNLLQKQQQQQQQIENGISATTMTSILNVIPAAHHSPSTNNIKKQRCEPNYLSNSVYEDPIAMEFAEIQMGKAILKVLSPASPAKLLRDANSPLRSGAGAGATLPMRPHSALHQQVKNPTGSLSQVSLGMQSQSYISPSMRVMVPVKREDLRSVEATRSTIAEIVHLLKSSQKLFISQLLQVQERERAWDAALRLMEKFIPVKSVELLVEHLLFLAECCLVVEAVDKAAFFLLQANLLVDMTTTTSGRFKTHVYLLLGNLALVKQRYANAMSLFKKALQYAWFYEQPAVELLVFDRLGLAAMHLQDAQLSQFYHRRYAEAIYEVPNSRARTISYESITEYQSKNEYDQAQLTPIVMIQLQLPVHYQLTPFTVAESVSQENAASPTRLKKKLGQDERFEALMKQSAMEGENFKKNRTKAFETANADKILDAVMASPEMELEMDTPLNFVVSSKKVDASSQQKASSSTNQKSAASRIAGADDAELKRRNGSSIEITNAMPAESQEKKLSWIAPVMRKVAYDTRSFGIVVDPRPSERVFEDTKKYKLTIEEKVAVMKKQKFNWEKALQTISEKVISNRKHNWVINKRVQLTHASPNRFDAFRSNTPFYMVNTINRIFAQYLDKLVNVQESLAASALV